MFYDDAIVALTNETYYLLADVRNVMAVLKNISEVFI